MIIGKLYALICLTVLNGMFECSAFPDIPVKSTQLAAKIPHMYYLDSEHYQLFSGRNLVTLYLLSVNTRHKI